MVEHSDFSNIAKNWLETSQKYDSYVTIAADNSSRPCLPNLKSLQKDTKELRSIFFGANKEDTDPNGIITSINKIVMHSETEAKKQTLPATFEIQNSASGNCSESKPKLIKEVQDFIDVFQKDKQAFEKIRRRIDGATKKLSSNYELNLITANCARDDPEGAFRRIFVNLNQVVQKSGFSFTAQMLSGAYQTEINRLKKYKQLIIAKCK
jgi:hypothetical protein